MPTGIKRLHRKRQYIRRQVYQTTTGGKPEMHVSDDRYLERLLVAVVQQGLTAVRQG